MPSANFTFLQVLVCVLPELDEPGFRVDSDAAGSAHDGLVLVSGFRFVLLPFSPGRGGALVPFFFVPVRHGVLVLLVVPVFA